MPIAALPSEVGASSDDAPGQIFDIKRFSTHDGPGIRTTVFFTHCPLRCAWCHNPEAFALCGANEEEDACASDEDEDVLQQMTVAEMVKEVEKDVAYYDRSGGGVTVSGGEPLMQAGFVEAFLRECRRRELHTAVDTSGHASQTAVEMVAQWADLILYDIKSIDDESHALWTGVGNKRILENLKRLNDLEVEVWIRLPLIPGVNDDPVTLETTLTFLQSTRFRRISLLPYHRIGEGKYRNLGLDYRMGGVEPHSPEQLERIRRQIAEAGFEPHIGH
ncbi:glycyl-radical enzyme activating protein [Verrucomicrobiaceae bacterium N1E253]|uniref:Glycyl-radical enzyme activating protein n=1 Tax=Oceaniferula marina TaxID=2748318 RepID=A0A851GMV3_9BACT|nr:glycyl-radical enzyme activating protein [Oceaniferula marina]NWK56160.1 glycyl-radical enzyme activating protein [Oceaniferula marina]